MTGKAKSTEPTPSELEASEHDGKRSLIRHPLTSLSGLIAEAARVYRAMRDNKIDHGKGRSLVWVLSQMRAMVETQALERLEHRLEELAPSIEGKSRGFTEHRSPGSHSALTRWLRALRRWATRSRRLSIGSWTVTKPGCARPLSKSSPGLSWRCGQRRAS